MEQLKNATSARIWIGLDDKDGLFDMNKNGSFRHEQYRWQMPQDFNLHLFYIEKDKNNEISLFDGKFTLKAFYTQGHTSGSVLYYAQDERLLFVGDTAFIDKIGFRDTPNSGYDEQKYDNALKFIWNNFDKSTRVYPGHWKEGFELKELENNIEFMNVINK
ncbi:hydroxyacylglutathione hydrolase [Spiroplasma chinense]|uniref:Hydroxyacylglutathione hydrolase n=1 Tax=Spiroplasma chinense TaxID=216932 RepID=A0A5B9Y429_9MOLU|nr:hydroxyacylglutathione hydrolase [Spiroplasma chinense]